MATQRLWTYDQFGRTIRGDPTRKFPADSFFVYEIFDRDTPSSKYMDRAMGDTENLDDEIEPWSTVVSITFS
jgi:hypothetical protein